MEALLILLVAVPSLKYYDAKLRVLSRVTGVYSVKVSLGDFLIVLPSQLTYTNLNATCTLIRPLCLSISLSLYDSLTLCLVSLSPPRD